ncbi:MAG: Na+/H+ antiporter NhaA [Caldilineaceae bacterium]|nr:Na+/H+ antiporter NhaA [Caldilineaceae bacterium]
MSYQLVPKFDADDLVLRAGGQANIVIFIDYTDDATRRIRDVLSRSLARVAALDLTVGIRFYLPEDASEAAKLAAAAAIAADRQGKFVPMHTALYDLKKEQYTPEKITSLAERIGLNIEQFETDLASDAVAGKIARDRQSARESVPVPHTPMLFVEGQFYDGVWDDTAVLEAMERPFGVRLEIASSAFFRWAASAGLVLIVATVAALLFVNLGWAETYQRWSDTIAGIIFGSFTFELPITIWVNDGLMALFFLVVGIEIKRELVDGELSSLEKAAMPLIGAVGGMVLPALIYTAVNWGRPTAHGWGIPMATDIAFTLGILALLGSRVPTSLKVFVSALAIVDDLGAIVVIALFYGHGFHVQPFIWAGVVLAAMFALNRGKVYQRLPYMLLFVLLWYFVYESGLHATLAGVLTAAAIPSRNSANVVLAATQVKKVFQYQLRNGEAPAGHGVVSILESIVDRLRDPGFHLQHALEGWNNYLILPLFAFFNTGIALAGSGFSLSHPEVAGTMLGLLIGKPLGIWGTAYLATKFGIARLSSDISWLQLFGAATLCGIGFTMSIFIASAALGHDQAQAVKLGILLASLLAGGIGSLILWRANTLAQGRSGS